MPSPSPETVTTDAFELANRLRPVLLHIARHLRREAADLGVTSGQATLLSIVRDHPGIGVGDLADRERISAPSMSATVDRLEQAGYILRTRSEEGDRRRVGLTITPEGARVLRAVRSRRTAWLVAQLETLSPRERRELDAAVDALAQLVAAR